PMNERIAPIRSAEDRAAPGQQPTDVGERQLTRAGLLQQTVEAILDADDLPTVEVGRALHHGADHGVQPRAVPAAGQYADAANSSIRHQITTAPASKSCSAGRSQDRAAPLQRHIAAYSE